MSLVLCYHRIDNHNQKYNRSSLSLDDFNGHIKLLRRLYNIVSLEEILKVPKSNSIAITFDDGYVDNLLAAEILAERNLPATFFISSYFVEKNVRFYWDLAFLLEDMGLIEEFIQIGGTGSMEDETFRGVSKAIALIEYLSKVSKEKRLAAILALHEFAESRISENYLRILGSPMTPSQVNTLSKHKKFAVAPHTHTHPSLGPSLSSSEVQFEVQESDKLIQKWTHKKSQDFALPFGTNQDRSEIAIEIIKASGFERTWTTDAQTLERKLGQTLPRLVVGNWNQNKLIKNIIRTQLRSNLK